MDENRQFPGNQEEFYQTSFDLPCNCDEFQEIRKDNLRLKSCIECSKEYAYCFCNEVCNNSTTGSISKHRYEYLTCDKEVCEFLGVRCSDCRKLCTIFVSKDDNSLFWGCNNKDYCHFYKQKVVHSLRNYIKSCLDLFFINEEILCKLISRYVDNLKFIDIIKKLNHLDIDVIKSHLDDNPHIVSAIENELFSPITTPKGKLNTVGLNINNSSNIDDLNQNYNLLKVEIQEKFKALERNLELWNEENAQHFENDFQNLEEELRNKNKQDFIKLEEELKSQNEKNFNKLGNDLKELQVQSQENYVSLKDKIEENSKDINKNLVALFKDFKVIFISTLLLLLNFIN